MKVIKGILTVAAFSLFLVACGEKKEEAPAAEPMEEAAPAPVEEAAPVADSTAVEAAPAETPAE